jgi:hypothetical protein
LHTLLLLPPLLPHALLFLLLMNTSILHLHLWLDLWLHLWHHAWQRLLSLSWKACLHMLRRGRWGWGTMLPLLLGTLLRGVPKSLLLLLLKVLL